jgi:hypothetical protein
MATPYLDGPFYDLTCPAGHEARVLLGNPKHEVLFQMAAYSLLDENYRDAIATFGSSLEEFWEFALQCIYASQGVERLPVPRVKGGGRKARFENAWRNVFKPEPPGTPQPPEPPALTIEEYEIRNEVLHEGRVPTQRQAFEFGNKVLVRVAPAMQTLRWRLDGAVGKASAAIIAEAKSRLNAGEPTAALQDALILHDHESMPQRRLIDYMPHLRKMDELFASIKAAQEVQR